MCVCVCMRAGPRVPGTTQEGEKMVQMFINYISPYFPDIICAEKRVHPLLE